MNIDLLANNHRIIHTIGYDKNIIHEDGFATLERNYEFDCWVLTRHYNTGSLNDTETTLHKYYDEALKLYSQYKDNVRGEYGTDYPINIFFKASTWKRMFDVLENDNLLYFVKNEGEKWAIAEIKEDEFLNYELKDLQALVAGYIEFAYRPSIESVLNEEPGSAAYFLLLDEEGRLNGNYNNKLFDAFLKEFYRFKMNFYGFQGHIVFGKIETLNKRN